MYLIKSTLGTDQETGLEKELRIVNFGVDAETKTIGVTYIVVLVSPTGVVMKEVERGSYTRYNSPTKNKYDQLEQSPIGQGICQMLQLDIATYPDLQQTA